MEHCDSPNPTSNGKTLELNYQALIFSSQGFIPENDEDDRCICEAVDRFKNYLQDYGFSVSQAGSQDLAAVKQRIEQDKPRGVGYLVVLVVRDSNRETEIDGIVDRLNYAYGEQTQKVLVFCRIGEPDRGEKADCLKPMQKRDCKRKLRNTVLFYAALTAKKTAVSFLKKLVDKMSADWEESGIGYIEEYGFSEEDEKMFGLLSQNGLRNEFRLTPQAAVPLKDVIEFQQIIGDGSQFKQLDSGAAESLKKLAVGGVKDDVYKNSGLRKALIIHNVAFSALKHRPESETDCVNLTDVLSRLQYKVIVEKNKTAKEIKERVNKFANDMTQGDSCVLVVMSHGSHGTICGTDYSTQTDSKDGVVSESELLNHMRVGAGVKGKPRLVAFQSCRIAVKDAKEKTCGDPQLAGVIGRHSMNPASWSQPSPDQCGMIVAHSTSQGHFAYRGIRGSRFILSLCGVLYKYSHKEDVLSMINKVNYVMTHGFNLPRIEGEHKPMQLPEWTVQTDKKFFMVDTTPLFDSVESQGPEPPSVASLKPRLVSNEVTDTANARRES